jgi:ketosteroid isomerase-like protein
VDPGGQAAEASACPPLARDTAWAVSEETFANLRRGYEAFNRGDASAAMDLATPDVEWGTSGTFPGLVGVYRGPEALRNWMETIRSAWEKFELTPDEVVRDEGDVLVVAELQRGRGRGSGVEVEMRVFSVYSFREGKVRRRQAFTEREPALEAAGLSE